MSAVEPSKAILVILLMFGSKLNDNANDAASTLICPDVPNTCNVSDASVTLPVPVLPAVSVSYTHLTLPTT